MKDLHLTHFRLTNFECSNTSQSSIENGFGKRDNLLCPHFSSGVLVQYAEEPKAA